MMKTKKAGVRARKKEYQAYLASPYWRKVAATVIARDGRKCTKCGDRRKLEVHHISYAHRGQEHLYLHELTTLCRVCHKKLHKALAESKKAASALKKADKANAQKARGHGRLQTQKVTKA